MSEGSILITCAAFPARGQGRRQCVVAVCVARIELLLNLPSAQDSIAAI